MFNPRNRESNVSALPVWRTKWDSTSFRCKNFEPSFQLLLEKSSLLTCQGTPGWLGPAYSCLAKKKKMESLIHLLTLLLKTLGPYESPGEVFKNTLYWAPSSKILIQQMWSGPKLYISHKLPGDADVLGTLISPA